jgi:S-adenosylmethionine:tRNA ribosyltransferase-isomerase
MSALPTEDEDLLSAWSFELPEASIARYPLAERRASRLMHLDADGVHHRQFTDIVDLLQPGDALVLNDTTVIPARLRGEKAHSGGKVEVLLVRRTEGQRWVVLLNASKKPKPGGRLRFTGGHHQTDSLFATVVGAVDDEPGAFVVDFDGDALAFARTWGEMPLPPYLQRAPDAADESRYQTVFRDPDKEGSVAAPTAGLHFDDGLLEALRAKGVDTATVTLHVGPGTFLPMRAARLSEHVMHPEAWWLPASSAQTLNAARARGGRIVAVGTTSARVLESSREGLDRDAPFVAGEGLTRLFIKPGRRVTGFDALITNFHLPESTLLVLVGTLVGRQRILSAYAEAVARGYRFYSYGDPCFIDGITPTPSKPSAPST